MPLILYPYSLSCMFSLSRTLQPALVLLGLLFLPCLVAAQALTVQWDKTLGGNGNDYLTVVLPTRDGGYLVGGHSDSGVSGNKSQAHLGNLDYWVVKLNSRGVPEWDRTLGGNGAEWLAGLQQTTDGGFLLAGKSESGIGGDRTQASRGSGDFWLVKLAADGTKLWDKALGGNGSDICWSLTPTRDGGCVLGGSSISGISGEKTETNRGSYDYWLVKLDAQGTQQWDKTLGGSGFDELHALQQTTDGGYLAAGYSSSDISGDKTQGCRGTNDYWVVKLGANGAKQWDKTFGGDSYEQLCSVQLMPDGGYLLLGSSMSDATGDKTEASRGGYDYWAVKMDATGTKQWDKTYGGSSGDGAYALATSATGESLLAGYSNHGPSGDRTQSNRGENDFWLVQLAANGAKQWDLALGGSRSDNLTAMQPTADGGYVLAGISTSGISGEKTEANRGGQDYWVVKLGRAAVPTVAIAGDTTLCLTGTARLSASANVPVSQYEWNTGATTAAIDVGQGGAYTVRATFADGTSANARHVVRENGQPCATAANGVRIPNIITPNGDGRNDRFYLEGVTGSGWQLAVYNRWGKQVYSAANYQHEWGNDATVGLYYYVLRPPQPGPLYKGWLEVVR